VTFYVFVNNYQWQMFTFNIIVKRRNTGPPYFVGLEDLTLKTGETKILVFP
jgi:hypothetical protein